MKKIYATILLTLTLISLFILSLFTFKEELYTELIVNAQNNVDLTDISIFYSDINYTNIKAYGLSNTGLTPIHQSFVPYSEGFISKKLYKPYQEALITEMGTLSTTFQDYYETEDLAFFAFPGDLSQLKVIDRHTLKVYPLQIDKTILLEPMYVSYMTQVKDTLIVLAGQARSYHALVYTIDLNSLKVTSSKRLSTHPSALDAPHYALTKEGIALFIAGNKLQIYNPFTDKETFIDLPFEASGVSVSDETIAVYHQGYDKLDYILLDDAFDIQIAQSASLPSPSSTLVDLGIKDHLLAMVILDSSGLLFKNYMVLYNLEEGTMVYCLGLGNAAPLALIDLSLS